MMKLTTKRYQTQAIAIALLAGAFVIRGVMMESEHSPTFLKLRVTVNMVLGDYEAAAKFAKKVADVQNES